MIVHILSGGKALCGFKGTPNQWPEGHVWMGWADARAGKLLMPMGGQRCDACWTRLGTVKGKVERTSWQMPAWMEPFREYFNNTGGNSVETLMNGHTEIQVNAPLALLEMSCEAQAILLTTLHINGLLVEKAK